jgi:thiamine-monophosphate kinase
VNESDLLAHIYTRSRDLAARFPHILVGPGHDCAAISLPGAALLKVDQLIEGRHFSPGTSLNLIARKAIARPLSDIAASGGSPLAALAAATLPHNYPHADELFDSLARWAVRFNCPLVGGDIAASDSSPLALSITLIGAPHPLRGPVLRSGARPGDSLYITGSIGASFDPATGRGHHLTFDPRLPESRWLCDTLGPDLHAMMDISDGLGRDAGRMALASGVRIRLDAAAIPLSPGAADPLRAASQGEDYELLFATSSPLPAACPASGVPFTRIGTIEHGSGCTIKTGSQERDAGAMGWDHGRD